MNLVQFQCWEPGKARDSFEARVCDVERGELEGCSQKRGGKYRRVRAGCKICINTGPEICILLNGVKIPTFIY